MMGFLLVIVYFGLALLAAVIIMQADRFVVTRSAVVDAPPREVFRHINELRMWEAWSPWAGLDPRAQTSYAGPPAGEGAVFEWSGDGKVGAGRMTIVDSRPNERIDMKLEMRKPFAATNDVCFTLTPDGGGRDARTRVVWTMSGKNSLMSKAMGLVMNRDKIVGGQFEKGLAKLGAVVAK